MPDSRRLRRLQIESIDVPFRGDVSVTMMDLWREDHVVNTEGQTYLCLDFAVVERVDFLQSDLPEDEQDWRPTGEIVVELQQLDEDGQGLALPTYKSIAGEDGAVLTWAGWQLAPCSPRRPGTTADCAPVDPDTTTPIEADERCLMCGSPDVVYHDADNSPRCASHVGESPEACVECGSPDVVSYDRTGLPRCAAHPTTGDLTQ